MTAPACARPGCPGFVGKQARAKGFETCTSLCNGLLILRNDVVRRVQDDFYDTALLVEEGEALLALENAANRSVKARNDNVSSASARRRTTKPAG